MKIRMSVAAAALCCASIVPTLAGADPWEVRREIREGARSVAIEKREAAREIHRCETRECMLREVREGRREVNRERREARHEIRRERAEDDYRPARHYNGNDRYYGDGRYYRTDYRDAHYHPNGQYCRDGRHIVHLRDNYYRGDRRWYRDGRYWNEYDYVSRYYRAGDGRRNDDEDNDDLLRGIVIGAAAVGVIAAIHEANDDD